MNKKTRYIVLTAPSDKDSIGGVVVLENKNGKTTCFVSLFGVKDLSPILLIDDLVKVRQFEISPSFSEIDLDSAVGFATDIVVGLFDKNKRLLASGSTFGEESPKQRERLAIALEKDGNLEHFMNLAKEVFDVEDKLFAQEQKQKKVEEPTFLQQTELLLFELFAYGVPDKALSKFVPNSKWVKLFLSSDVVGIGIVEHEGRVSAIGLAFPVLSKAHKHKGVDKSFCFFPQNLENPNGFGYYIVLQDAKDGSVVSFK